MTPQKSKGCGVIFDVYFSLCRAEESEVLLVGYSTAKAVILHEVKTAEISDRGDVILLLVSVQYFFKSAYIFD